MRYVLLFLVVIAGCSRPRNASELGTWQASDLQRTKIELRPGGVAMIQTDDKGRKMFSYRLVDANTIEFTNADGSVFARWTNVRIGKSAMKYIVDGETEERSLKRAG